VGVKGQAGPPSIQRAHRLASCARVALLLPLVSRTDYCCHPPPAASLSIEPPPAATDATPSAEPHRRTRRAQQ